MKTVSIVQSNYIPWKGYFDIIARSDEFLILDAVQFTKNDWRNRNRIKVESGSPWLTIPVKTGGRFGQTIAETEIDDPQWARRHWARLSGSYRSLPGFQEYSPQIAALYDRASGMGNLSEVNRLFIDEICKLLGIGTTISSAAACPEITDRTARIVSLCQLAGADRYLSGPAAQSYIDAHQFERAGIEIQYMDYGGYAEYPQIYPPFDHSVSVLDLIFCVGKNASSFMKFSEERQTGSTGST